MNFFDFIKENLLHVAPILTAGGIGVAILLERFPALVWTYPMKHTKDFFDRLRDLMMADRTADAVALCEKYRDKLAPQIAKEGLLRAHQPETLIEDELELAVREAGQKIQKFTPFLATIANVSTLMGLFGTIIGLIQSFNAVGNASPQQKSALLAAGISTAMNATMLGLAVAIPCMIAFSYLMNRTNRLMEEVDQAAVRTMSLIRQRYYAAEEEITKADKYGTRGD
jgi:biopolymer transport protein ExbB